MNNIEDKYPTLITLKGLGLPEASFGRDKKIKANLPLFSRTLTF